MPSWMPPQNFWVDYVPSCSRGSKAWFFSQVLCESQFTSYLCSLMKLYCSDCNLVGCSITWGPLLQSGISLMFAHVGLIVHV